MTRLGQYLAQIGALDSAQFEEAYRAQRVHGGRLGTNLVELGFLVLDELAEHLAAFHNTPMPPVEWLESPDPKALKLVPMALIRRFNLLPLKLERDCIHVAMVDPTDEQQLDFLRTAANRNVRAYVLPEVRIMYWLEMHCGIDRQPRYVNLAARVRQTGLGPPAGSGVREGVFEVPRIAEPASQLAPLEPIAPISLDLPEPPNAKHTALDPLEFHIGSDAAEDEELLLEDIVALQDETPASAAHAAPLAATLDPGEIAALEAQLQGADDRDDVIELGLRVARGFARSAALFVVRGDTVAGHRSATGASIEKLEGIELPISAASIFTQPAMNRTRFRGLPPHDGMDGRILAAMGRPEAHEVLIVPIAIRGRVVNLLYVDNGADALGDTSVAALTTLAETMARAYERLILEAKRVTARAP